MASNQQNLNLTVVPAGTKFINPDHEDHNNYAQNPAVNHHHDHVQQQQQNGLIDNLPIGYRFVPDDEELITHYLKLKIANQPIPLPFMYDANIYKYHPQRLTEKYPSFKKDEWLFFTPRDRKYPNGSRPNRAAGNGYWKATGADKRIHDSCDQLNNNHETYIIGYRKVLVYHEGKPPKGKKIGWVMHEYRVEEPVRRLKRDSNDMRLDDWVLCRIYWKAPKEDKINNALENDQNHVDDPSVLMNINQQQQQVSPDHQDRVPDHDLVNARGLDQSLHLINGNYNLQDFQAAAAYMYNNNNGSAGTNSFADHEFGFPAVMENIISNTAYEEEEEEGWVPWDNYNESMTFSGFDPNFSTDDHEYYFCLDNPVVPTVDDIFTNVDHVPVLPNQDDHDNKDDDQVIPKIKEEHDNKVLPKNEEEHDDN